MFLSLLRWVVLTLVSLYLTTLKEKQLENVSTRQKPGDSSLLRLLNTSSIWFRQ